MKTEDCPAVLGIISMSVDIVVNLKGVRVF